MDVFVSDVAPNGTVNARAGKLCLYKNGSTYEQWQNVDGGTTWQRTDSGNKYKILDKTRDMTAASGNVSYTGAGFKPSAVIIFAMLEGTTAASWGMGDISTEGSTVDYTRADTGANNWSSGGGPIVYLPPSVGNYQSATLVSLDTDGMTLAWIKGGLPTGTANLRIICFG